jgi:hypothetical protein
VAKKRSQSKRGQIVEYPSKIGQKIKFPEIRRSIWHVKLRPMPNKEVSDTIKG